MKYSPNGRTPTTSDIERAGLHNPVIRACLLMVENGQLSVKQGLMAMVLALADQNETLIHQLVQSDMRRKTIILQTDKPTHFDTESSEGDAQ